LFDQFQTALICRSLFSFRFASLNIPLAAQKKKVDELHVGKQLLGTPVVPA
jgi:hypothetical protein